MFGTPTSTVRVTEPVTGWRAWNLDDDGNLVSPDMKHVWHDASLTAQAGCECGHAIKLKWWMFVLFGPFCWALQRAYRAQCVCGVNAFASRDELIESRYAQRCDVIGTVRLSGRVREYDRGYRGEKAYATAIWSTRAQGRHQEAMKAADRAGIAYQGVQNDEHTRQMMPTRSAYSTWQEIVWPALWAAVFAGAVASYMTPAITPIALLLFWAASYASQRTLDDRPPTTMASIAITLACFVGALLMLAATAVQVIATTI